MFAPTGRMRRRGALSGGNQQKLLIARALERRPRVLVAENPTRGLDLLAAAAVHAHLRAAAAGGAAVLIYSNDLDEVLELGERILVAANGVITEAPAGRGPAAPRRDDAPFGQLRCEVISAHWAPAWRRSRSGC